MKAVEEDNKGNTTTAAATTNNNNDEYAKQAIHNTVVLSPSSDGETRNSQILWKAQKSLSLWEKKENSYPPGNPLL